MKRKQWLGVALAAVMAVSLSACGNGQTAATTAAAGGMAAGGTTASGSAGAGNAGDTAYPEHDLQGYITYGAGGGTDTISRAIAPGMEKACLLYTSSKSNLRSPALPTDMTICALSSRCFLEIL